MNFNPFRPAGATSTVENPVMNNAVINPAGERADTFLRSESTEARFQKLKTSVHRLLLDSLDLSRIAGLTDDELRADIRRLAESILRGRPDLGAGVDEERLVDELVAESFGLGPLE